jgi:uncharacterized protein
MGVIYMNQDSGKMTVEEAGKRGGQRTAETHGREFYQEIGRKGGQTVRDLIERGRQEEGSASSRMRRDR